MAWLSRTETIKNREGIVVKDSTNGNGTSGKSRAMAGTFTAMAPPETTTNELDNSASFLSVLISILMIFLSEYPCL
jgi:hypothetical protein